MQLIIGIVFGILVGFFLPDQVEAVWNISMEFVNDSLS